MTCRYCGGSFEKEVVPYGTKYDLRKLKVLIESDPNSTVVFYGGEPLVNREFISNFTREIRAKRYGVQTNGTLVRLLKQEVWKRMDFALLSIDGREETTDKMRGRGIYSTVVRNAKYLKELGLELIARMTVTEHSDIYEDVTHLLSLGLFDKIHWQLNVVWTEKWNVKEWSTRNYIPGIERLMELFMKNLMEGRVLKIIPILGVLSSHYFEGYRGSPCGAGYGSVSITPDGRVLSCPIAVREKWAELGTVEEFKLYEEPLPEECRNCKFNRYCGGRCYYSSQEKYWGEEGFQDVDEITKKYLCIVLKYIPVIDEALRKGIIKREMLYYDPKEDSTEVVP
ncbi:radical SAM/SPASM domain-containing protein [Sulfolobales archaeon HS-7]|nr:radical SAM/SPASM domain-containing protein [Sulfolobales archaeon HS-7]